MVAAIIVNGVPANDREAFLACTNLPGPSPFEYALTSSASLFPQAETTVLIGDCQDSMDLGSMNALRFPSEGVEVNWNEVAVALSLDGDAVVLVLNPLVGVVSPGRIQRVYEDFVNHDVNVSLSAHLVDSNMHPSYSRLLSKEHKGQDVRMDEEPLDEAFDPVEYISSDFQKDFPHHSSVPGSQWLPPLYQADRAVVVCRFSSLSGLGNIDMDTVSRCVAKDEGTPVMVYRLPVFMFNESIPVWI